MNWDLFQKGGQPKPWVLAVVLGGGVALYLLVWFLPEQRRISALRTQLISHQQHVERLDLLSQQLEVTREQLAAHERVAQSWRQTAPTRETLGKLYAQLSLAAEAAEVKFTRFDPTHRETHQLLEEHDISLAFQGSFQAVHDFIHRVEQLPETIWIIRLHVSSGPPTGPLEGELTLTIFTHRGVNSDQVDFDEPIEKEGESAGAQ